MRAVLPLRSSWESTTAPVLISAVTRLVFPFRQATISGVETMPESAGRGGTKLRKGYGFVSPKGVFRISVTQELGIVLGSYARNSEGSVTVCAHKTSARHSPHGQENVTVRISFLCFGTPHNHPSHTGRFTFPHPSPCRCSHT